MLDQLLNEASRQTKDAVAEASTPPPIDQLLLSRSRPISVVAWKGPLVALGAATAVLLIALLSVVLRSDAPSDQPTATLAPEPPVTAAEEATIPEREVLDSAPATEPPWYEEAPPLVEDLRSGVWQRVAVGASWVESVIDLEALPNGGFVAVTDVPSPWNVMWSPDGVEWFQGDPDGTIAEVLDDHTDLAFPPDDSDLIAVMDTHVAVVDLNGTKVWVGDPRAGDWQAIPIDTSNLADITSMAIAASDSQALVVGWVDEPQAQLAAWLIDPAAASSQVVAAPLVPSLAWEMTPDVEVGWLSGRWLVGVQTEIERFALWTSVDLVSWQETALPDAGEWSNSHQPELGGYGGALTTAKTGAVVRRPWMGGGDIWYSPDGLQWQPVLFGYSPGSGYSEDLGFVAALSGRQVVASMDGVHWTEIARTSSDGEMLLGASGANVLLGIDNQRGTVGSLLLWSEQP